MIRKGVLTFHQKQISISTSVGNVCPLESVVNRIFQTSEVSHTLEGSRKKTTFNSLAKGLKNKTKIADKGKVSVLPLNLF